MLIMDVAQLEPEEFRYEERIRIHYAPPNNHLMLSALGKVSQWMATERTNQTDVVTLGHGLAPDQIPAELDLCVHHINTIHDAVTAEGADADELVDLAHVNRHASRLVHYENRLRRLATTGFSEEQTRDHGTALRQARLAKAVLTTRILSLTHSTNGAMTSTMATSADDMEQSPEINGEQNGSDRIRPTLPNNSADEPQGRPLHESTLNNNENNNPLSDQSMNTTPLNAQLEVNKRLQAETQRRAAEYQICRERMLELHEDIYNEYVRPIAMNRPMEASHMMARSIGLAITMKSILRLTSDLEVRRSIERDISLLVGDRHILESILMRAGIEYTIPPEAIFLPTAHQQTIQNTASNMPVTTIVPPPAARAMRQRAQSTLYPTIPLFDHEIDNMTFNMSHPYTAYDYPAVRNAGSVVNDARSAQIPPVPPQQVRFGPSTIIPSQNTASSSQAPENTQPTQSTAPMVQLPPLAPPPITNSAAAINMPTRPPLSSLPAQNVPYPMPYIPPHQLGNALPRGDTSAGTVGSIPTAANAPNRTYHPAISIARYPEYAPVPVDANASRLAAEQYINRMPAMNAFQGQQYLAKSLGNRRYSGHGNDGSKTIGLDEFICHIRAYQRGTRLADAVILNQLSTLFTGRAFLWWETNGQGITSIDQLEMRLKSRFERVASDEMTTFAAFCSRRQERNEDLLDYIDDMRRKAGLCGPTVGEPQIITRIVDNATDTYRRALASKQYETVDELVFFAEYLVRDGPKPRAESPQVQTKPKFQFQTRARSINAVETEAESTEKDSEAAEGEPDVEHSMEAMIEALANVVSKWQSSNHPRKQNGRANVPQFQANNTSKAEAGSQLERKPFVCYGCGTPNVYQRDCVICNPTDQSKNASATS